MRMSSTSVLARFAFIFTCVAGWLAPHAAGQITAITYQGQLKQAGGPLNAAADFEFRLFDAASAGVQIGGVVPINNLNVVNGLFTVSLDFGPGAFNGSQRWLQIAVRTPAGSGGFTTLSPRQAIGSAPYALYALTGPGSGGPWAVSGNNIFTTNTGKVGIGTSSPFFRCQVAASFSSDGVGVVGTSPNSPAFSLSVSGFGTSYLGMATDAFNFSGQAAPGDLILLSPANSRLLLQNGHANAALAISGNNVGIGTPTPVAKLQVIGDVRLGSGGQFFAPAGEENLRIVRGMVNGNGAILEGSGFSVVRNAAGDYTITFSTSFADAPTMTVAIEYQGGAFTATVDSINAGQIRVYTSLLNGNGLADNAFHFIAIGPR